MIFFEKDEVVTPSYPLDGNVDFGKQRRSQEHLRRKHLHRPMAQPQRPLRHCLHDHLLLGVPVRAAGAGRGADAQNHARKDDRLGQNRDCR